MDRAIWCFAEGRGGSWEAICLDLDLSVQGDSFDQVYQDLHQSIEMYLEYVAGLPQAEQAQFLNRRAPLWLRLRTIWMLVWSVLQRRPGGEERAGFLIHCHA